MNKHDFFVCPALDGTMYEADINLRTSAHGLQKIEGRIGVRALNIDVQARRLLEIASNQERIPARILDQPFALYFSNGYMTNDMPMDRRISLDFVAVIGDDGPFTNKGPLDNPTAIEIKVMIDQLNAAVGEYIVNPSEEGMERSKLAHITVHAGINLVFHELEMLRAENQRLKEQQ